MKTTTKQTHTPTPWRIERGTVLISANGKEIGHLTWGIHTIDNYEEQEANAAFIVRAVNAHEELLEFAKEYAAKIAEAGCACGDTEFCRFHQRISKAIAQAEGKANV